MASNTNTREQDRKELEKYVRFFVIKAVQIIVQARLGQRVFTECKTISAGSDWFNIGINDVPEVYTETKRCLADTHILSGQSINIEISLKTKEGDAMVLEVWTVEFNTDHKQQAKISYTVYNRLGVLLKSLYCLTRSVNVYKLSRTQGAESFVICYRVFAGQSSGSHLGANEAAMKVGSVGSPLGTVNLTCRYRTQMLISPDSSLREKQSLELKENYFKVEGHAPSSARPCQVLGNRQINEQMEGDTGSVSDLYNINFATSPPQATDFHQHYSPKDSPKEKLFRLGGSSSDNTDSSGSGQRIRTPDKTRRVAAFAPRRPSQISLEEEVPFSLLLEMSQGPNEMTYPDGHDEGKAFDVTRSILDDPEFAEHDDVRPNDFVFVDLKTPFAVPDTGDDLGRFYRSCQTRPDLKLNHGPTIADTLQQLDLDKFETKKEELDNFFKFLDEEDFVHGSPV